MKNDLLCHQTCVPTVLDFGGANVAGVVFSGRMTGVGIGDPYSLVGTIGNGVNFAVLFLSENMRTAWHT